MRLPLPRVLAAALLSCAAPAALLHCSDSSPALLGGPPPSPTPGQDASSSPDASPSTDAPSAPPPSPDAPAPPPADGSSPPSDATTPHGHLVAYASGYAPTLHVLSVNETTGALADVPDADTPSFGSSPSFLAWNPSVTNLYAVDENATGQVGAYAVDPATGALAFLGAASSGGNGPPYVHVDASGKYVLVANYGDGTVSVLPVGAAGKLGAPLTTLSVGANAHMILPDPSNHFVFVPCLGADYVAQFVFDAATGALTPNAVPHVATAAGAGPRHLAFDPAGARAYLVNEKNSTLTAYALDGATGQLSEIQTVSTLPAGFAGTNTCAEVWVHPSGAWVLASNRGDDSLAVLAIDAATGKMTAKGWTKTGGTTPRQFSFDPAGAFVYVANQGSGDVTAFQFDATQGTLTAVGASVAVTGASFVGAVRLPGK